MDSYLPRAAMVAGFTLTVATGHFLPFAIGAAAYALSLWLDHQRAIRAMQTNEALALADKSADAKAMAERMTELERQLKEALTPERMELARNMLKAKLSGALGR